MENSQQFNLRWNNYLQHISGAFDSLRTNEDFVDVTLSCEGKKIKAHKMLLSACSNYFRDIFKDNQCSHPVIVFQNIKFEDLSGLVTFMYQGQVNVEQECLQSFLNTAELLEVQGLTTGPINKTKLDDEEESTSDMSTGGCRKGCSPVRSGSPGSPGGYPSTQAVKRKRSSSTSQKGGPVKQSPDKDQPERLNEDEDTGLYLPHSENSLTQDNYDDPAYFPEVKSEEPDVSPLPSSLETSTGPSNDIQDSLQVFAHGLWRRLDPSLKRFNCDECGKVFKHPRSLDHHKKMHEGRTTCPICRRVFGRMYALRLHISASHPHVDLRILN